MSRRTVIVCDHCQAEQYAQSSERLQRGDPPEPPCSQVHITAGQGIEAAFRADLCPPCVEELKKWFGGRGEQWPGRAGTRP
jgi:hypothetical protein